MTRPSKLPHRNAEPSGEALLEAIFEDASEGFVLVDDGGMIRAWSAGAARIFGRGVHEMVGRYPSELGEWPSDDIDRASPDLEHRMTVRRPADPTTLVPVALRHRPVIDTRGLRAGTLWLVRDVTDEVRGEGVLRERERALGEALRALRRSHQQLKSTQLQLIQAAKLESMGRIAAGVAHEVKNPLAIVLTGTQLLRQRLPDADPIVAETLDDLEHAVRRANGIIMGLLDFAASTELKLEVADLDDLVSAAIQLIRHELNSGHIRIEHRRTGVVPPLLLDRTKIEQVLVNLLMNAIHAMPKGGTIAVAASVRQLTEPGHGVGFRQSDTLRIGQTVAVVEIDDSGTGIPSAVLGRIFDPFFTTKGPGKGAGLGLAVCRTIVNLHGGTIWLDNRSEGGARATLVLPAGENRQGAPREQASNPTGG